MRFLTEWRISLDKVPAYVEFNQEFKEHVDIQLARMILEYEGDERLSQEVRRSLANWLSVLTVLQICSQLNILLATRLVADMLIVLNLFILTDSPIQHSSNIIPL